MEEEFLLASTGRNKDSYQKKRVESNYTLVLPIEMAR
jgi:hypothetical protein